jgi:PPP family 3-phenylpropionic acid transporter
MFRLSLFFFLLFATFSALGALMPLYLKDLGLTTEQIGLQLAMGAVIAIVGQPFFGYVSDKIQSTKKVLITVMILSLVISFVYFSVQSFLSLLSLFVILNFFKSSTGPLIENITISYSQKHDKNYGLIRLWGDVGIGSASVILGILIGLIGIQYLGVMYAVILMTAILVSFFLQDGRQKTTTSISLKTVGSLLKNKEYLWFLLLSLFIFTTHRMNDSLFTVYLSDIGATDAQVGLSWMLATFASVPLFIFMSRLLKKYQEMTLILIASVLYVIRWILYSFYDEPLVLIQLQLLNGLTFPLFIVAALFYVTKIIPKEIVATGQTIFIAVIVGLGGLIGSGGGGLYMAKFEAKSTYLLGAGITSVGAILCLFTLYVQSRHLEKSIFNKIGLLKCNGFSSNGKGKKVDQ